MVRHLAGVSASAILLTLLAGGLLAPSPADSAVFNEIAEQAGIIAGYNGWMGGGVAIEDFDNDGDFDVAVAGGPGQPNRLFVNEGPPPGLSYPIFREITASAGLTNIGETKGIVFADVNNDALPDLIFGNFDRTPDGFTDEGFVSSLSLYLNNGDATFTDITDDAGLAFTGARGHGPALSDVDLDGWLDVYASDRGLNPGGQDFLFRNRGDLTFQNVTQASGIGSFPLRMTLQAGFFDYDNDGDQDLYIAADKRTGNQLFRNEIKEKGTLSFTDVSVGSGADLVMDAMCVTTGDYDNDGDQDLYVTNVSTGNALLENLGDGTFENRAILAGVSAYRVCWGSSWLDFDNDMKLDLYVASMALPSENLLYRNLGNGTFRDEALDSGCQNPSASFGFGAADLDLNGHFDLIVSNGHDVQSQPDPVAVYMNRGEGRSSVSFKLIGIQSNWDAVGAHLTLEVGATAQTREIRAGSSYLSQEPKEASFGLGFASSADRLFVRWPSGRTDVFTQGQAGLEAGQRYRIIEGVGIQTGTHLLGHQETLGETQHLLEWEAVPWPGEPEFRIRLVREDGMDPGVVRLMASVPRAGRYYRHSMPAPTDLEAGVYRYDVFAAGESERLLLSSPSFEVESDIEPPPFPLPLLMGQNFPNPFFGATQIPVNIPDGVTATIKVFDFEGRLLSEIPVPPSMAGAFTLDRRRLKDVGSQVPSGVYYYQLYFGDSPTTTRFKMVLLP